MSSERTLETVDGLSLSNSQQLSTETSNSPNPPGVPSDEEIAAFTAKRAEIVNRSQVQAGLEIKLPDYWYGEWIPNAGPDIAEAKMKEFIFPEYELIKDSIYADRNHSDGTARAIYGDTVFMVMPKWKKAILDAEQDKERRKKAAIKNVQTEEQEFLNKGSTRDVKSFAESTANTVYVTR